MTAEDLSDNAIMLWTAFFLGRKSTLTFGGDGAKMMITPEARRALYELLAVEAVEFAEPSDQIPNREYYRSGPVDLREQLRARKHLSPFSPDAPRLVAFVRNPSVKEKGGST